jgi:alkaline phosphatase
MKANHTYSFIKSLLVFFLILTISQTHFIANFEFYHPQETKRDVKSSNSITNKSIILMIGDGMGFEHLKLARWVELGKDNRFPLEQLPMQLNVTTRSADNLITDSAAAATAIATGNKTDNGMLSISPLSEILETILEISYKLGKSTGIVTTTEITHATPAAFMTHVQSRSDTTEISRQIAENSTVNVLFGGGSNYFSTSQLIRLEARGYDVVSNRSELMETDSDNLIGLFAPSHLPYEIDREQEVIPSLTEMTMKAIEILSQDPDGFFLMVEGGRIDHAGHANDKANVALETIEFSHAVDTAISFSKEYDNVLLLITADHETGGLKILNSTLNNNIPLPNNTREENNIIRIQRINNISVDWSTTSHTNSNVPFFGYNTEFSGFTNLSVIDNTDTFKLMNNYLDIKNETLDNPPDNPPDNLPNNLNLIIKGIVVGTTGIVIIGILSLRLIRNRNVKREKNSL